MKTVACVLLAVLGTAAAEPPTYRKPRFEFQRQELKPTVEREQTTPKIENAPYAASGFKPSREFKTPSRQEAVPPSTSYGVPADSYGAPLNIYSAPERVYGVPRPEGKGGRTEGKEREEAEKFNVVGLRKEGRKDKLLDIGEERVKEKEGGSNEVINQKGAYYVLLPDSQLQRVQFQTQNDLRNMAYTARLQYRNEDRAPVYVYTSVPDLQRAAYIQLI